MQVHDLMKSSPMACSASTNLAEAAAMLWNAGCGALPVVDQKQHVIGILTDRDICICCGTGNRRPSEVTAAQAMTQDVAVCHADDEIHRALKIMRFRKLRRLPVVSPDRTLLGMLSVSELLLYARHDEGSSSELSDEDVMSTLRGIYVHCPPHCECAGA